MKPQYLELGPELNRHSRAYRASDDWITMGLSEKNTDLDHEADIDDKWPFASNTFDIVFGSHVMEHAKDAQHFVSEAFRVLRHGGTIRMNVPDALYIAKRYVDPKDLPFDLFNVIRNLRSWHGYTGRKAHWNPFDAPTIMKIFKTGFYRVIGGPESSGRAQLFKDVAMCAPGESRVSLMRDRYFSTRQERTIRCEGTKP